MSNSAVVTDHVVCCSICGIKSSGEERGSSSSSLLFSKRQRKKAMLMGEPARCNKCIESTADATAADYRRKQRAAHKLAKEENKQKRRKSNNKSVESKKPIEKKSKRTHIRFTGEEDEQQHTMMESSSVVNKEYPFLPPTPQTTTTAAESDKDSIAWPSQERNDCESNDERRRNHTDQPQNSRSRNSNKTGIGKSVENEESLEATQKQNSERELSSNAAENDCAAFTEKPSSKERRAAKIKEKYNNAVTYYSDSDDVEMDVSNSIKGIGDSNGEDDHSTAEGSFSSVESSTCNVTDLKRKILGRDVVSARSRPSLGGYEFGREDDTDQDSPNRQSRRTINNNNNKVASSLPELKRDLTCPVCHDILFQPVSLVCGHSFCHECLSWWIEKKESSTADNDGDGSENNHEAGSGTCPTCRRSFPKPQPSSSWGVNTALRACAEALFPDEIEARKRALRRSVAGEAGGAHSRGYEVLAPLAEEPWHIVETTAEPNETGKMHPQRRQRNGIKVRRSVVLDAHDQRMQLTLVLRGRSIVTNNNNGTKNKHCGSNNVSIRVHICLVTMEEDEATDGSGFPFTIPTDSDDEHLVCSNEDRFRSTCIEVLAKMKKRNRKSDSNINGNSSSVVPLARICMAQQGDGSVEFFSGDYEEELCTNRINGNSKQNKGILSSYSHFLFRHDETGAELEMEVPRALANNGDGNLTLDEQHAYSSEENDYEHEHERQQCSRQQHPRSMVMGAVGDYDDHEEGHNEYEYDEFLVQEEESESGDDDDDVCCICKDGGELMICDGGIHLDGCGRSFHFACVGRSEVPAGDWVCQTCAKDADVLNYEGGSEGHEFPPGGKEEGNEKFMPQLQEQKTGEVVDFEADDDSDDDDIGPAPRKRGAGASRAVATAIKNAEDSAAGAKRNTYNLEESSDEEETLRAITNSSNADAKCSNETSLNTNNQPEQKKRRFIDDSDSDED